MPRQDIDAYRRGLLFRNRRVERKPTVKAVLR